MMVDDVITLDTLLSTACFKPRTVEPCRTNTASSSESDHWPNFCYLDLAIFLTNCMIVISSKTMCKRVALQQS